MSVATPVIVSSPNDELAHPAFGALRAQLTGSLITAAAADYDAARALIYFGVDRQPLAVVKAANAEDVAAAVTFARAHGLPLSVRGGGHSLAAFSVIDGAIVVDLSGMKRVTVDPVARTARVQGGATSGDLAGPAHEHDLALTTGDTRSVGLGGLVTGGGIGFMARKYGLTIDHLLKAQVVTANGEIVTASEQENADLFWAIRGGGGNFGIVTEFTFRLHPVGQILGGMIVLPATKEVLRGYLDEATAAPEDLTTIGNLLRLPPLPFVPQERVGELALAILVCWSGSLEDGEKALAPLRALAEPIVEIVHPMPYPEIYRLTDHQSASHGAAIRSMFANEISDESLDAIFAAMERPSSPMSIVHFRGMGGAVARVAPDATAFAHRTQPYFFAIINLWLDPNDDGTTHRAWANALWNAVRTDADGVYVNFLEDEGPDRIREAYPAPTLARLAEIKAKYDPTNLFRFNQNIAPKA